MIGERAGREHEHHAPVERREQRDRAAVADALARDGDVHALRAEHAAAPAPGRRGGGTASPHGPAAFTTTRARTSSVAAAERVARRARRATRPRAVERERARTSAWFTTTRAGVARGERVGEGEARVVGGGVEVASRRRRSPSAARAPARARSTPARSERPVAADVAEERERVVEREPGARASSAARARRGRPAR